MATKSEPAQADAPQSLSAYLNNHHFQRKVLHLIVRSREWGLESEDTFGKPSTAVKQSGNAN